MLAGLALAVADRLGVELPPLRLLTRWGEPTPVELPHGVVAGPGLLGSAAEQLLDIGERKRSGAWFTPPGVAAALAGWALDRLGSAGAPPVVLDPAAGGGAFLLAAAEVLGRRGLDPVEVVSRHLVGVERDPVSAAVAEAALALWCGGGAVPRMAVGDALAPLPGGCRRSGPTPDVVLGNPPFATPLRRAGAAGGPARSVGAPYADLAVRFLRHGLDVVAPGGTVALLLPQSFLATRDAGPARQALLDVADLEVLWVPGVPVFAGTAVRICAVVARRRLAGAPPGPLRPRRFTGNPPRVRDEPLPVTSSLRAMATWSSLVGDGPRVDLGTGEPLGRRCAVAADFRDVYYGLAPFVVDDPHDELEDQAFPPLVTSGLVDPAALRWGQRPVRYQKRRWVAPRVDREALATGSGLGGWARCRLVPKIVVATQTRVVEAAVDEAGAWLPCTPVLSVVVPPPLLWHVAAALLSPPATAWALQRCAGAALGDGAIKLGAADLRALPLPPPGDAWDGAADAVRRASAAGDERARRAALLEAAEASTRAYGLDDPGLLSWWAERLPAPPVP